MSSVDWLARIEAGLGMEAGYFQAASGVIPAPSDGLADGAADALPGFDGAIETRLLHAFRRIVDQGLRLRIIEMVEECAAGPSVLPRRS